MERLASASQALARYFVEGRRDDARLMDIARQLKEDCASLWKSLTRLRA